MMTSSGYCGIQQDISVRVYRALLKAGLHGASREARQVNKQLAPSYLLRVDINFAQILRQGK
jgi:hypothetical protein